MSVTIFPPDRVSKMVVANVKRSFSALIIIGVSTAILVSLVAWWLIRRIAQPVNRLGDWARTLNENTLEKDIPDFVFKDLNDFAHLVRNSLMSLKSGLDREQRFLRHTSHELRTPISVIQNNIELLNKLHENKTVDEREKAVLERLNRASRTMKDLTETLLWLSKTHQEPLPAQPVSLDQLIQELCHDLNYLLDGKPIELTINTEPSVLALPETATHIVLGNLIRNAFQHTQEGTIVISQTDTTITIENPDNNHNGDALGFGLGLQLVEQLTEKLDWDYQTLSQGDHRKTVIVIHA